VGSNPTATALTCENAALPDEGIAAFSCHWSQYWIALAGGPFRAENGGLAAR